MSIVDNNRFRTVKLDEYEIEQGSQLSGAQAACIQNLIAGYAHDIINIPYDDLKPAEHAIRQAYYRGAIEALEHLLHTDEEIRLAVEEQRRESVINPGS